MKRRKRFTVRPTEAAISRLAMHASLWPQSYWYSDGLKITLANYDVPELDDLLILFASGDQEPEILLSLVKGELA